MHHQKYNEGTDLLVWKLFDKLEGIVVAHAPRKTKRFLADDGIGDTTNSVYEIVVCQIAKRHFPEDAVWKGGGDEFRRVVLSRERKNGHKLPAK